MGSAVLSLQRVAPGAKKPGDSQKAKALWTVKAGKGQRRRIFTTQPPKKRHSWKTTDPTGLVGSTPQESGGNADESARLPE